TVAGSSEWETLEIAETVSEMFDEKNVPESISAVSCGNSAIFEGKENAEEKTGNESEMEMKTEISESSKTETKKNQETPDGNQTVSELSDESKEDIDKDFSESFMKRFFKGIFPWKGDSIGEVIRKIIFIAASAVFIGAGCMLASTLIQSQQAVEQKEKDREIIVTTAATTIDESGNVITIAPTEEQEAEHRFNVAEYYKGINKDYVGYLELSGCDIAEPIVKGEDNDYYLTHAIHGGTNKAGTVFMDYRCTFTDEYISPNIVFYGHNQEDLTMFGSLKEYKQNVEFYGENPVVRFSTENNTYEYLIYGFFVTNALERQDSNGEVFHYQDYIETMSDENTFDWYLDMVYERNQIVSPVDVVYGDKLLCLSTCSNEFSNSRFVIFARMLREGESVDDFDFSETYLNPYARGVDWEAIMSGETSATEVEILDEDDEDDGEIVGNGFLETAVHVTRRPAAAEMTKEAETTTVPDEENKSETDGETTTKKRKKETSQTEETNASETSGLEEATRKKTSETSADISES
ncbi:MAG: class B sortase, partial [Oscillospiraceae bacterium]|nr:class B sortase [Oscillospiraceae bacterium]